MLKNLNEECLLILVILLLFLMVVMVVIVVVVWGRRGVHICVDVLFLGFSCYLSFLGKSSGFECLERKPSGVQRYSHWCVR